jgi:hypothetical protein
MGLESRTELKVRVPPSFADRLKKVCDYLGTTGQALMQDAVLEKIGAVEAQMRADTEYRERERGKRKRERAEPRPVGLGVREAFEARAAAERADREAQRQQQPVAQQPVVVVTSQQPADDMISAQLVTYIVTGDAWARDIRRNDVLRILSAGKPSAEADRIKVALDGKIAAATTPTASPQSAPTHSGFRLPTSGTDLLDMIRKGF